MSYIFVDGNSLGYAGQYSNKLTNSEGQEVQAIFYFIKSLRRLLNDYPEYQKVMVLWDRKAFWRFDLYPEYKGNRKDDPKKRALAEAYKAQTPMIEQFCKAMGVNQIHADGFEADDLAGFFVRRATSLRRQSMLLSSDEDWIQLVNQFTQWHCPRHEKHVSKDNFEQFTGFRSGHQFVSGKALQGDASDNIAGVGGIGEKGAKALIDEFGTVENMIDAAPFEKGTLPKSLTRPRLSMNRLAEDDSIYRRNYKLMNLMDDARDPEMAKAIHLVRGEVNHDRFDELCEENEFFSLLKSDNWLAPFQRSQRKAA